MVLLLTLSSCIAAIAIVAIVAIRLLLKKESKRVVFTGREHHTFPSHTEK